MNILLVEDNPGDVRLVSEMLGETTQNIAQFCTVGSLQEAKEVSVDRASVTNILLDLGLPDSEGINTLIAIRDAFPNSAIVVLTGFEDEELTLLALREGAQSYLSKNDLTPGILDNSLRYSLERHRFIMQLKEQEHHNGELRVSEEMARSALESEKHLSAMKSKFVSLVSHEFRTPLAVIQTSADLIDRHAGAADPSKVHAYSQRIQTKVSELTAMLNDLLDLEKLEREGLRCKPIEFDLGQLAEDLVNALRPTAKLGQSLVLVHNAADLSVVLDYDLVNNILTNLVSNAIKYSPEDATITIYTGSGPDAATVAVEDRGIGIPKEEQEFLFERFFRGSNVNSSHGTGLGLPIVKEYLNILGGKIDFTSVPGHTVFTVTLPRRME